MGDRVLFQFYNASDGSFSPAVYGHWAGHSAPGIIRELKERMKHRLGDMHYSVARLVQALTNAGNKNEDSGVGVWNAEAVLNEADSHGDAGVILINLPSWKVTAIDGYLEVDEDGVLLDADL